MENNYLVKLGNGYISHTYEFAVGFKDVMSELEIFLLGKEEAKELAKEVGGKVFKLTLQEFETKSIEELAW